MSLLQITGVFVLVYFGRYLFTFNHASPPYAWIFRLFIIVNFVSILVSIFDSPMSPISTMNLMTRFIDSYIIFNVAYYAALQGSPAYYYNLVRSIAIGLFIALAINFVAIIVGYQGRIVESDATLRVSGLYYDPGVLSIVAVYAIVFSVFMANLKPGKNAYKKVYAGLVIVISLYILAIAVSRSAVVLLSVFAVIYLSIYKKGIVGRLVPIIFLGVIFVLGAAGGLDYYKYVQRFGSEVEVLTDEGNYESRKDKDVDLGRFEHFGSNRGMVIAYALDKFIKRPAYQMIIGNFTVSPAHSDYFDVLSRNGFIGLVLYIALLVMTWKRTLKYSFKRNTDKIEWKLSVLGLTLISMYILYAFPFRPLLYTTISWLMWATLGTMFGAIHTMNTGNRKRGSAVESQPGNRRLVATRVVNR